MGETQVRSSAKRMGYVKVSLELLGELLKLPENHRVVQVWYDFDDFWQRTFRVVIEGSSMPDKPEGAVMEQVDLIYREDGEFAFTAHKEERE